MTTSPKNQQSNEEEIFAGALRLPPEQRAAYLDESTKGNPELRQRVESLLKNYEAGDFLERPVAVTAALSHTILISLPLTEKPGDRIGRYKLLQQIGEGGCGVVYMAEQEEPVRRRVALKVIKLGMDTKSVIARFEAERQALALMDHPNIAKVFDAGATETGRPYFVMELVRGMKITDYCDEAKLSIRDRLNLFSQVCNAIQHAHQKGIIHRDIKPSNVLVTVNDGVATPKVIDFGIAKATGGQQLTDKTLFTAFEQFIGTPAYMSPEQAVITSLDVDTRSDIYALGVLLYELLTGKTPFDTKELLAIGFDEMRRTIREKEPMRPSTSLSTMPDDDLGTMAQRRGLDAPKLVTQLRGDLDWVVMKCLEKDRARRYETASGLAKDIWCHLNNEPVVARPPDKFYRFQKLVRRNQRTFVVTGALAAALVTGFGISAWLYRPNPSAVEEATRRKELNSALDRLGSDNTNLFPYAINLLHVLVQNGKNDEASGLARKGVDWIGQHPGWPVATRREFLGKIDGILKDTLDFSGSALAEVEDVQILRSTLPVDKVALRGALGEYTWTLLASGQATNAEASARESLPMFEDKTDEVGKFWVQSMLGESLTKQKRYAEAGPLLLSAYEGANANKAKIPDGWGGLFFGDTIQRLTDYYDATGQAEEAAKWRNKLAEFQMAEAAKKPTGK